MLLLLASYSFVVRFDRWFLWEKEEENRLMFYLRPSGERYRVKTLFCLITINHRHSSLFKNKSDKYIALDNFFAFENCPPFFVCFKTVWLGFREWFTTDLGWRSYKRKTHETEPLWYFPYIICTIFFLRRRRRVPFRLWWMKMLANKTVLLYVYIFLFSVLPFEYALPGDSSKKKKRRVCGRV